MDFVLTNVLVHCIQKSDAKVWADITAACHVET